MDVNTFPAVTPPKGFRFMLAHEADQLQYAEPVTVWDGSSLWPGVVTGHTDESMKVMLRSGAILTLDLDHPDYWPIDDVRDRRPPHDGTNVVIKRLDATPDEDVEPLLRTSVALAVAMKDDTELQQAVARLREIVRDRLTHRPAVAA